MTPTMLLVHSPLLTPASWDPLRPHLEAAGWRVVVLDLRPLLAAPSFHGACVAAAVAALTAPTAVAEAARTAASDAAVSAPTVVVGHSRAGGYLPGIAEALGRDGLDVVFLDARLPYPGQSWVDSLPPDRAREAAATGRLPAWDTWFPAGSFDGVVPREVLHDLPELPWSLVSEVLPAAGGGWATARRVYLQLSAAYQSTSEQAEKLGYAVRRADADHLAMATAPALVAELLGQAPSSNRSARP